MFLKRWAPRFEKSALTSLAFSAFLWRLGGKKNLRLQLEC